MAGCGNRLPFQHFVANRALLVSASRLLARRGFVDYPFAPRMALCGDFLVCTVITAAACIVCFPARLGTCRFFSVMVDDIVPQFFHGARLHVARIIGAYSLLLARFRAARCLRLYPFAPRMARCGDFLRFQHFVADRALLVPASRLLARRGGIYYPLARRVPGRGNFLVCRIVTARACIIRSPARLGTRCFFSFVMDDIVPQCRYGTSLYVA